MKPEERCAKCGACNTVCPIYQATGRECLAARGKLHLLGKLDTAAASASYADILSKCLLCGACHDGCPRSIDTPNIIMHARQELPRRWGRKSFLKQIAPRALSSSGLLEKLVRLGKTANHLFLDKLPQESGLRLKLLYFDEAGKQLPESLPAGSYISSISSRQHSEKSPAVSYFTGCLANYLYPSIGLATDTLLSGTYGSLPAVPAAQTCCGLAAAGSGNLEEAKRLAKKNIAAFEEHQLPILTSCASCYSHLSTYPELLAEEQGWRERATAFSSRLCEFSTFFNRALSGRPSQPTSHRAQKKVIYHDPCHLRFGSKIIDPPRQLINKTGGLALAELPNGPQCCGQGGLFRLAHPDLSKKIMDNLLTDFASVKADLVVTTCSGCLLQWQEGLARQGSAAPVKHLGVVMAEHFAAD